LADLTVMVFDATSVMDAKGYREPIDGIWVTLRWGDYFREYARIFSLRLHLHLTIRKGGRIGSSVSGSRNSRPTSPQPSQS